MRWTIGAFGDVIVCSLLMHLFEFMKEIKLDCTGMACPEPLIMLKKAIRDSSKGDIIKVLSDDPVSLRDFPAYCKFMRHEMLVMPNSEHQNLFIIKN